jgi:DNA-binding transcriptional ArsR family regulator
MSDFEEEPYSTIFTSLKHPARRKILRILSKKPRNFSEILEALGMSSSHLTYHLENLGELVSKTENGKYKLSTFGEAAVTTMSKVEEVPRVAETKRPMLLTIKWKSFFAVLMIGLVVLAGVSYIQYRSLNKLSTEYEELKELVDLVEKGASFQSEYTLRYEVEGFEFDEDNLIEGSVIKFRGPSHCVIYVPYDNFTLYLVLSISTILSESYVSINMQEGNVFDLGINETAPVIWSANATASSTYSVPLASQGWYTISLGGQIINIDPFTFMFWIPVEDIDCSMSLRIIYEGKSSPFIVTSNLR